MNPAHFAHAPESTSTFTQPHILLCGGTIGAGFTLISHPFHVLYTRHCRYTAEKLIQPSTRSSFEYAAKLLKSEGVSCLFRGALLRTFQGAVSYSILFALKNTLEQRIEGNSLWKELKVCGVAGAVENCTARQMLLTTSTAWINHDKLSDPIMWKNTFYRLPITTVFRSAYLMSSVFGRNFGDSIGEELELGGKSRIIISASLGTLFGVPWIGFAEVFTSATARGQSFKQCIVEGTRGSLRAPTDVFLLAREGFFLFPFIFSEPLQKWMCLKLSLLF